MKPSPNNYTNIRPSPTYPGTGWRNTEYRTYTFADSVDQDDLCGRPVDGDNASIVETRESRTRRGRPAEAPSRDLQKEFYVQAMTGWENQILEFAKQEAAKKVVTAVDIEEKAGEKVVTADGAEDARVIA
ncbi:hypothetical protein ACJ73_10301 [Blastomyces percursus]|uniref:Uncharacterized protein n=1 Tax=Blastomyces percursus TaxID=1658174 RepID=A0A1J9Q2Q5_9EURO|nr:hypothetical protein ACJ73_10301 [Blastomyces percursus]